MSRHSLPTTSYQLLTETGAFSTYLGGSGSDYANAIALGPGNDIFVVGGTESVNFPTTNAFQPQLSVAIEVQEPDAFITRLEAGGKSVRYSTYYGWADSWDRAWDVAVDTEGNAYVALIAAGIGHKWMITKISADGSSLMFERSRPEIPSTTFFPLIPRIALTPDGKLIFAGAHEAYDGGVLPAINQPDPWITAYSEV